MRNKTKRIIGRVFWSALAVATIIVALFVIGFIYFLAGLLTLSLGGGILVLLLTMYEWVTLPRD